MRNPSGLARVFAGALCALVALALAAVVLLLPDQGPSLARKRCSTCPKPASAIRSPPS